MQTYKNNYLKKNQITNFINREAAVYDHIKTALMSTPQTDRPNAYGGAWLINPTTTSDTFIPEAFQEEQLMVRDMCHQFLEQEIIPLLQRIEALEPGLMPALLLKAGAQGLLGISVPEHLGGSGKDFITATLVNEGLGSGFSFSVAIAAHTGIGMLPILYFGNENQKSKYIPKLASGEWKASYGLTEPNSGSDALGARTTATLTDDGQCYILNGQKCWITNGGFADVYTVFAKVNGEQFTAFIVERGTEGFTQGPEEHKMGIKGSSTVALYFQDCKIPVDNVLGEIGKGHIIAFNILNIGRLKLCAAVLGGAKMCLNETIRYAQQREQFKKPIATFGAIQYKLAEMAIRIWVCDSSLYRVAKWIDDKEKSLSAATESSGNPLLAAAEEFAIECAILKVEGSEVLDFVADESVQIHGGNGFSDEYAVSRVYRDSRINRIFEGTNEINRLLIVDMLLKRAMKGRLDLMTPAMEVAKELMSIPDFGDTDERPFAEELKAVANMKKAVLLVAGAAVQKLMMQLHEEQEIVMNIADMAILTFNAESALLRVMKIKESFPERNIDLEQDIFNCYLQTAMDQMNHFGKSAMQAFAEGDELRMMLIGLKRFTKTTPFNAKNARRNIAQHLLKENQYPF